MLYLGKLPLSLDTKRLEFSQQLDLSNISLWGDIPFPETVSVSGTIEESYDEYILNYQVSYRSFLPCARCLTEINMEGSNSFTHTLRDTGEDPLTEDNYIPMLHRTLDLALVVASDLLLELEEAPLCKPDCLGLCPVCGGNRNQKPCDCKVKIPDPRFDVLRKLLDKSN